MPMSDYCFRCGNEINDYHSDYGEYCFFCDIDIQKEKEYKRQQAEYDRQIEQERLDALLWDEE